MGISKTSRPVQDLRKMVHMIFGPPKTGKTTLASQFPGIVFLATEKGLDHLEAPRWVDGGGNYVIRTWEDLFVAVDEVAASKQFTTIALDTVGNACALADDYVCRRAGEEFRGDGKLGFGKGAAMIANEIRRFFMKISTTGLGVILIAHSTVRTVSTRTGDVQKVVPFVPGDNKDLMLYNLLLGMCDTILFFDALPDGSRVIRTKPAPSFDAGDRSNRLPAEIKLDSKPENMFAVLYESFYGRPMRKKLEGEIKEETKTE